MSRPPELIIMSFDTDYCVSYDDTGRTDESAFSDAEAMGWDAYFESLFQRIDRSILDEDKKRYQGEPYLRVFLAKAAVC